MTWIIILLAVSSLLMIAAIVYKTKVIDVVDEEMRDIREWDEITEDMIF